MSRPETKTGQSIDERKKALFNPALVQRIEQIPGLGKNFSLLDVGSGDATSSRALINALSLRGYNVSTLGLMERDLQIFPDLLTTVNTKLASHTRTEILQTGKRDFLPKFFKNNEQRYEVGIAQLVLHQIPTVDEASYLMYQTYHALSQTAELFVIDLHPDYLDYLSKHEPNKLTITTQDANQKMGRYHFDLGGEAEVYMRDPVKQLAMFLDLGFDVIKLSPLAPDPQVEQKDRVTKLAELGIPMFYLMQLRKNPENFVSNIEGRVKSIQSDNQGWLFVTFADGEAIEIPTFNDWENVELGSNLALHQTYRKQIDTRTLNYWVISPDEKVRGGKLVVQKN